MKIISDNLEALVETWSDPGDYPSNAGSCPLPSYDYFAGMDGELIVELTEDELRGFGEAIQAGEVQDFIEQTLDPKLPDGILKAPWEYELKGRILTLWSEEAEADPDYDDGKDDQEPDDFDDRRWEKEHGEML